MKRDASVYDAVIAGGGVIGCSLLLELTRAGLSVVLVERQSLGSQASRAAAGVISVPKPTSLPVERVELTRMAFDLYPGYVAELESATGLSVDFATSGDLLTATSDDDLASLKSLVDWLRSQDFRIADVSADDIDEIELGLSERVTEAWYVPNAARVSGRRLSIAMAKLAAGRGARIIENEAVTGVIVDGDRIQGGTPAAPESWLIR